MREYTRECLCVCAYVFVYVSVCVCVCVWCQRMCVFAGGWDQEECMLSMQSNVC
jgi:hypothetical protein